MNCGSGLRPRLADASPADAAPGALPRSGVGVTEVHVASSDAAANDYIFGGLAHDDLYGPASPGCTANAAASQDLNAGTCYSAAMSEWYSWACAFYFWNRSCSGPGTPLFLHYALETPEAAPIRCLVIGDEVAVDSNQALATRRTHIYWGPEDANHDGKFDAADADWVLAHVQWVRNGTDHALVNLNHGTQNHHRWDWYDCGLQEGYDDGWIHAQNAVEDALYLGVCYLNPPP